MAPDGGDLLALRRADILIHRFDVRKLSRTIAAALGLAGEIVQVGIVTQTWRLGTLPLRSGSAPVYLTVPFDPQQLETAIAAVASDADLSPACRSFLLLTPTRGMWRSSSQVRLRLTNGRLLPANEAFAMTADGDWVIPPGTAEWIHEVFGRSMGEESLEEPLGERGQYVLLAMLEMVACDSDARQPTDEIARSALGDDADANALKQVMAELKSRGFIRSKTGRGGGCWLTDKGRVRATKLGRQ